MRTFFNKTVYCKNEMVNITLGIICLLLGLFVCVFGHVCTIIKYHNLPIPGYCYMYLLCYILLTGPFQNLSEALQCLQDAFKNLQVICLYCFDGETFFKLQSTRMLFSNYIQNSPQTNNTIIKVSMLRISKLCLKFI